MRQALKRLLCPSLSNRHSGPRRVVLTAALLLVSCVADAELRLEMGTLPGALRFDIEEFEVKPNERVTLILTNNDAMQHNWVLCQPGPDTTMRVAKAAWALGADATDREFIPDTPDVIAHTAVADAGNVVTLEFRAPEATGDYPYVCTLPGHAFTMNGVMRVTATPSAPRFTYASTEVAESDRYILQVHHEPVIKRAFVEEGPARSVLVGLPGGVSYCFDADACVVRFGWFGQFLDVGPDWGSAPGDRGGRLVKTLGDRFDVGSVDMPIRIGAPYLTPNLEFQGYRWSLDEPPTFHYLVNGVPVTHQIHALQGGLGLRHIYSFREIHAPVYIKFDDRQVELTASHGEWDNGVLRVPEGRTDSIEVSIKANPSVASFE